MAARVRRTADENNYQMKGKSGHFLPLDCVVQIFSPQTKKNAVEEHFLLTFNLKKVF